MVGFQSMEGGKPFLERLRELQDKRETQDIYLITALDAETFGHHIQNWERLFLLQTYEEIKQEKILSQQQKQILEAGKEEVKAVTVSELLTIFPKGGVVDPKPSSWSTTAEDLTKGEPYPLWSGKDNKTHMYQWESLRICLETVRKALEVADDEESKKYVNIARLMLDRAEHNCQFWWASKKPWWDINMVAKGLQDHHLVMVNAYRAIKYSGCSEEVKRDYYHKVIAAREFRSRVSDELFM